MRKLLLLLLLCPILSHAQVVRGLFRTVTPPPPTTLTFVGADSINEGTSQAYQLILTSPDGTTLDVTQTASFSASRGSASGVSIATGSSISVSNATNSVRGDNRITTLWASYSGVSGTKEIVLKDQTTGYTTVVPRMVTASDISKWPQMKIGDLIIEGATFSVASQDDYSVQIRSSQSNVPTLSPGATIWVKGGRYTNFTLQLNQSRVPVGQPPIEVRNYDGQVEVQNTFTLLGAQGAKISGKYEPGTGKGDADYTGHASGNYAFTVGRYGWLFDNKFLDNTRSALVMDGGVRDIEWEFLEIRSGYFSSMLFNAKNYDMNIPGSTTYLPFENIVIHDLYIHDLYGEGVYIGSTDKNLRARIKGGRFYNCRVLRVGHEGLQFGQNNSGMRIYNNVVHSNFNWRDAFQKFQDNSLQITTYAGVKAYNNLFLSGGEKHLSVLTRGDSATGFTASPTDTLLIRNNAFLYNRGGYEAFYSTLGAFGARLPINNLTLVVDNNLFGKNKYIYNQVYTDVPDYNNLFTFDLLGFGVTVRVTNNTYDGSNPSRTTWVQNLGSIPVYEANNTLTGVVPHPSFENYMGLPSNYDYARVERWAGIVGSLDGFPADGTLKGTLITVPVGDIRMRKGIAYESKATGNTNIEPTVAPNWRDYWNVLYWNRKTGELVRNPTSLAGLSSTPPDNTRLKGFYATRGIGLL